MKNNLKNMSSSEKTKYIISTHDNNYIKQCISDREKLRLGSSCVVELIIETKDLNYIIESVNDRINLRLAPFHLVKLIIGSNNNDFIKKCVDRKDELELCSDYVSRMILATKDSVYINNILNSKKYDSYICTQIILNTIDISEYKNIIEKNIYNLNSKDLLLLINKINDIDYTKWCISNYEKLGINISDIISLIFNYNDINFLENVISTIKFNDEDLFKILFLSNSLDFINLYSSKLTYKWFKFFKCLYSNYYINVRKFNTSYSLPQDLTIGIEIESIGLYSKYIHDLNINSYTWGAKGDETVQGNESGVSEVEVISPIMHGLNQDTFNEIYVANELMVKLGQFINSSCGGHIHIGFNYINNYNSLINLIELWSNLEFILYILCNSDGTIPRGIAYASPISKDIEDNIDRLAYTRNFEELKKAIIDIQGTKGKAINFLNLLGTEKNTIEFRCPNGTLDYKIWIQNIFLFGSLVKISKELSDIQKSKSDLIQDIYYLDCFKVIKSASNLKTKLNMFLNLITDDENIKKIYIRRFNKNYKLLKENKRVYSLITSKIASKAINIK